MRGTEMGILIPRMQVVSGASSAVPLHPATTLLRSARLRKRERGLYLPELLPSDSPRQ